MANLSLGFSVSSNFDTAATQLNTYPERLDRALHSATEKSADILEDAAETYITSRAGGMYWPLSSRVNTLGNRSEGRVVVSRSAPHQIRPKGDYPLRFKIDGKWVSTYLVNHPGSRPVDWTPGAQAARPVIERAYRSAVEAGFRRGG